MTQSRLSSFIESIANVMIGFWINFMANMLILPLFGWHINVSQNIKIGIIYTAISIVRSYCIRRWFNKKLHKMAFEMAERLN